MNEKITLLIEQCTTKHDSYDFEYGWTTEEYIDNEKLAYLIVKECARIANAGIDPKESHLIGDYILEHFGVKE